MSRGRAGLAGIAFLITAATAVGQNIEVTPLVGTRQFGTVKLDTGEPPRTEGEVAGSISYGVAAGYRWESDASYGNGEVPDHDLVEFRWMRQNSHLYTRPNDLQVNPFGTPLNPTFRPSVTFDHFLADFTHEFAVPEHRMFQPFLTIGFGASYLSMPASGMTRFAMDLGGGLKVFPTTHYGFRVAVEYLPTVMLSDNQKVACAGGGCVLVLTGGILNQLSISFGPSFRF